MVKAGEKYSHYKGTVVEIVAVSQIAQMAREGNKIKYSASPFAIAIVIDDIYPMEAIVIYTEMGQSQQWARPLRIFGEVLGETPRFTKIS